jgi:GT2 family glycosyltransferase
VIAFAACVAQPEVFSTRALPGLRRVAEPGFTFAELSTTTSILEAYNEALDHFSAEADLEALVLLHEDTELLDPEFGTLVRAALADPDVAVVGAVGARNVTSLAWWDGEMAGGVLETRGRIDHGYARTDVEAVDGLLMVLSPWAVRNLRFDAATYTGFHAYDVDFCFAARAAGKRVEVTPLTIMHHTKGGYGDKTAWDEANRRFQAKWGLVPEQQIAA